MTENPSELERSLVRAVAELAGGGRKYVKLNRVLEHVVRDRGESWQDSDWFWDETLEWPDEIESFYNECVKAINAGVYLEGIGNYGGRWVDPDDPSEVEEWGPAHPKVLECGLTDRGRALADAQA